MEYLSKQDMRKSIERFNANKEAQKGIALLERHIGYQIKWLHPQKTKIKLESGKQYAVIDEETKEVIFEANRLSDIAGEYCMKVANVSRHLNTGRLLNEKYSIVRCEYE